MLGGKQKPAVKKAVIYWSDRKAKFNVCIEHGFITLLIGVLTGV